MFFKSLEYNFRVSFSVGYFVGNVQPGGPQDYKVGSFGPYYRMWTMHLKYNSLVYDNSEFFGNYNYAITGSVLFRESALLAGSMAVSILKMRGFDDAKDISDIKKGYSERYPKGLASKFGGIKKDFYLRTSMER